MFLRTLSKKLPTRSHFFLLGPRQTGKTTLLRSLPVSLAIDLLNRELFIQYAGKPDILYEEVRALIRSKAQITVWFDEVQKVPELLETVHRCMNDFPVVQFILSGSSARKLRRGAANLLGGRALHFRLHPLTMEELGHEWDLNQAVRFGTLPHICTQLAHGDHQLVRQLLRTYVTTYLSEEIHAEALVQNLDYFNNFLTVAASFISQQVNMSGLATKAGISQHFIRRYFQILEDTMVGFLLEPFIESVPKRMSKQPKFYLFDNGITSIIRGTAGELSTNGPEFGFLYEQFVVQEVRRTLDYALSDIQCFFWRTAAGAEVDLLLVRGTKILMAIECKSQSQLSKSDFSGLQAFAAVHPQVPRFLCAPVPQPRITDSGIMVVPLRELVEQVKQVADQ